MRDTIKNKMTRRLRIGDNVDVIKQGIFFNFCKWLKTKYFEKDGKRVIWGVLDNPGVLNNILLEKIKKIFEEHYSRFKMLIDEFLKIEIYFYKKYLIKKLVVLKKMVIQKNYFKWFFYIFYPNY